MDKVMLLVAEPMLKVEQMLYTALKSEIALVNELITGTIKSGGKRIRPLFHILTAAMCGYSGEYTQKIGTILEYIHTASLLHDDVIDSASQRRGNPSANSVYDNRIPVLAGDYLYTNAFYHIIGLPSRDFGYVLTKAVASMSEGEIFQMLKTGKLDITMDEYKQIIYGKTSALFTAACECGALLGNVSDDMRAQMRSYGQNVGYAFQMKDDLLDYFGDQELLGKTPGTDLEEKKVTLPVVLLYKKLDTVAKKAFDELFHANEPASKKLDAVLALMNANNIHEEAAAVVKSYVDAAIQNLYAFPASEYRDALLSLTEQLNYRVS